MLSLASFTPSVFFSTSEISLDGHTSERRRRSRVRRVRGCDRDRWCDAPGVTLFTSGGLAAPQRTVRVSARRFAPCEFRSTRGPRRSPAPFHPRPASLTRSFALPLRRSLASLYALTPASRSRARRRVSHAASSTLFPANPLPGVSLASSRDNLARRAPVWPAASRHPPPRERNPKSSRLVRWHRSRRGRNSAHHARFTRLARLTPSSPSSSRSGVSPVVAVARCLARASPCHRVSLISFGSNASSPFASRPRLTRGPPGVQRCVFHPRLRRRSSRFVVIWCGSSRFRVARRLLFLSPSCNAPELFFL